MPDVRLDAAGRLQAGALAERLRRDPLDAVYTSPLERALETAACLTPAPRLSEVMASPTPLPARSAIRLADGLAGRAITSAPDVPVIRHTDILAATVVEVSVKPSGFVFSATVFSSSGSKMADQTALDLARAIRFKPIAKTDTVLSGAPVTLNWGKIVFQWLTSEMPATNNSVAGAAP